MYGPHSIAFKKSHLEQDTDETLLFMGFKDFERKMIYFDLKKDGSR